MKMISEYLDYARRFERWANEADDAALKEQFLKQAAEYRELAEERAVETGMARSLAR